MMNAAKDEEIHNVILDRVRQKTHSLVAVTRILEDVVVAYSTFNSDFQIKLNEKIHATVAMFLSRRNEFDQKVIAMGYTVSSFTEIMSDIINVTSDERLLRAKSELVMAVDVYFDTLARVKEAEKGCHKLTESVVK